jgi:hypothetical protein
MLAMNYPGTRVYATARQMIRDHPPQDVSGLGITPPLDRSRGYRTAAVVLTASVVMSTCALFLLPPDTIARTVSGWWAVFLLLVVLWQVGIVWLLTRLLALQTDAPRRP